MAARGSGITSATQGRRYLTLVIACAAVALTVRAGSTVGQTTAPRSQTEEYEAAGPKSILHLQQFRTTSSIRIRSGTSADGTATLVNLNPAINAWYLLSVAWQNGGKSSYHLENPRPLSRRLLLTPQYPFGIEVVEAGKSYRCSLFEGGSLDQAKSSQQIYAPICEGRLFLRNPAKGYRTNLEAVTDFLRDNVTGGENLIVLFRHLLQDTNRETGELRPQQAGIGVDKAGEASAAVPLSARIDPKYASRLLVPTALGLELDSSMPDGLRPGAWYAAMGNPGIWVSVTAPQLIDGSLLKSGKSGVAPLDGKEDSALCYLVAFDLDDFDLGFALGTQHPGVGWSEHIQPGVRDSKLPGPDGIGTIEPLVSTGMVDPEDARRTVATFTGGFKRTHGAFKYGEFASRNYGSHYGFVERGVVFSKLQPGLATIFVLNDGSTGMKTWESADNKFLGKVQYARQNGVALVDFDAPSQSIVPGRLVNNWGGGNWSGSEDRKLRTIRAGAALQIHGKKRFLIYAVFSAATPSAMARVFVAYQCRYGMLLDMNALEHTYFALYRRAGSRLIVNHLMTGMQQVDKSTPQGTVPRFLAYPDNRDFFYVTRRNQ